MPDPPDFLDSLGALSLTLRMRRLADRLSEQGRAAYDALDIELEPGWYAALLLLERDGALSISDAATRLGVRHPTMVKTSRELEAAGLIVSVSDPGDARRRLIELSPRAMELFPEFQRVWGAFDDALGELEEAASGTLGQHVVALGAALDARGLDARVRDLLDARPAPRSTRRPLGAEVWAATPRDRAAVIDIARELVTSGETYAYEPDITDDELWEYWCPSSRGDGFVACAGGEVVGAFVIRPNQPGPGAHVANASYVVRADRRGRGLGRRMGEASIELATSLGYSSMQFNIVVSTNLAAVNLWRSLGFRIVGTIPRGFRLPDGRFVAHHIMYRELE